MTDVEQNYVAQGYSLPESLTWERVAMLRAHWEIDDILVPVAVGSGCIGWAVPHKDDGRPMKHP